VNKKVKSKKLTIDYCLKYRYYGLGQTKIKFIFSQFGIPLNFKMVRLSSKIKVQLRLFILSTFNVNSSKRLMEKKNLALLNNLPIYKSIRHRYSLPVRGQRTHTNARTQKRFFRFKFKNKSKN